jgi:hypothetical protein
MTSSMPTKVFPGQPVSTSLKTTGGKFRPAISWRDHALLTRLLQTQKELELSKNGLLRDLLAFQPKARGGYLAFLRTGLRKSFFRSP